MQRCAAEERAHDDHGSGADCCGCAASAAGDGSGVHAVTGLVSSVRQALEEGGCDELASARVLNLLEQDAVGRDLDSLHVLIELARSEKSLAATQQLLAAREAEVASLSQRVGELLHANAAMARTLHETRASGSTELQEQLQAVTTQLQHAREDFEDKKEQCAAATRVRNFLVDELSGANLQLQAVHALHAQAKVRMAELLAGIDLVLSGADPRAVFRNLQPSDNRTGTREGDAGGK